MQPTSASKPPILELEDVHAGYGDVTVLDGISMAFQEATCTAIVGANGAGKSSLLRAMFGEITISHGAVRYAGRDITNVPARRRLGIGIGYVPQGRCNFPLMTVRENLEMGAFTRGKYDASRDMDDVWELFPVLRKKERTLAGDLSGGEQQLLEMGMALMMSPRVLLIDEPSLGLAVGMQRLVFGCLQALTERGMAVVLVEQNAVQALEIAHRGVVVARGRVAFIGAGVEMLEDPKVRKAYLGIGEA